MYAVSDAYKEAIEQDYQEWKVEVRVEYANGEQAVFDDATIMNGIEINSQMVSGGANEDEIDVGAVHAKSAALTLIDNNIDLHRYSDAKFSIFPSLKLEDDEYEEVPMGVFFVDSSKLSRFDNQISITGYDGMLSFQYVLTDAHRAALKGKTATEAAQILAAYSVCGFEQDLSGLPNGNIPLNFDSPQVVTGWDSIMWIAQIMGCFGRISRENDLEFVPIMSKWEYFNEEKTVGTIISVRDIDGDQRYDDLRFADDRIHIIGVAMEGDNGMLVTREVGGLADDANITITLEKNPIIAGSGKPLESILDDILEQLSTAYFYAFRTVIKNDPSLDAGDVIRLTGGRINGTNQNNDLIGFITHSTWQYHEQQTITNIGQVPIVSADASAADTTPDISELAIGDVVTFTGSYHYKAAISDEGSRATPGTAYISNLYPGAPHPVHLIHTNGESNVYGWVNLQDVQKTSASPATESAAPAKARAAAPASLGMAAGFHVASVPQSQKASKGAASTATDKLVTPEGKVLQLVVESGNTWLKYTDPVNSKNSFCIPISYLTLILNNNQRISSLEQRIQELERTANSKLVTSDGHSLELLSNGAYPYLRLKNKNNLQLLNLYVSYSNSDLTNGGGTICMSSPQLKLDARLYSTVIKENGSLIGEISMQIDNRFYNLNSTASMFFNNGSRDLTTSPAQQYIEFKRSGVSRLLVKGDNT